ncbi:hypothetical protein WMF24_32340 [Sorangium sp. So ce1335]
MARTIGDPGLRAAVGQVDGDERRAEVVHPDRLPRLARLEELGAGDARSLEVSPKARRHVVVAAVECGAVLAHEHRRVGRRVAAEGAPRAEGAHDIGAECPRARLVRLVHVEGQHPALEVDIREGQPRGLAGPASLAIQEAVQHAPAERNGRGGEKARVLVGIEPTLRLAGAHLGQEPLGQGICGDEPGGEYGHRHHPVHQLGDVAPRRRGARGERAHDPLRVVQREGREGDRADDRVHVALEA